MAIVYLLHTPGARWFAHYLGTAAAEDEIDVEVIPHSRGVRTPPSEAARPVIADVWEASSMAEARRLFTKLSKQGSRRRLCSICSPGNARGSGTGRWVRQGRNGNG